ncbi:MAG: hypothetical protein PF904_08490 [Kiritimatiellae bacterium]|jgi:hypothetical protein|nr:hypothetical protein [Kiritimatiellia bacterium]
MNEEKNLERNLGVQQLVAVMEKHNLKPHDLLEASRVPMTHKLVNRGCKGRRLTSRSKKVVLEALQIATDHTYKMTDIFNY